MNYVQAVNGAIAARDKYQKLLLESLPEMPHNSIDEMALAFGTTEAMNRFEQNLPIDWRYLAEGADTVQVVAPFESTYSVRYRWYGLIGETYAPVPEAFYPNGKQMVNPKGFRIEAMRVSHGYNPLLEHWNNGLEEKQVSGGSWIHASFKVQDSGVYEDACYKLIQRNWIYVQQCRSNYGLFSYFRPHPEWLKELREVDSALPFLYLKARVNTRDNQ